MTNTYNLNDDQSAISFEVKVGTTIAAGWDFAGRVELEFDRLAVSFESVHRMVTENKLLNSFRNVGILQYKVNDNFYLTGTFGKNFGGQPNLIAFLGLNFRFGKTVLTQNGNG